MFNFLVIGFLSSILLALIRIYAKVDEADRAEERTRRRQLQQQSGQMEEDSYAWNHLSEEDQARFNDLDYEYHVQQKYSKSEFEQLKQEFETKTEALKQQFRKSQRRKQRDKLWDRLFWVAAIVGLIIFWIYNQF